MYFGPLIHLQTTKKRINERCSSLVQTESGRAMVNVTVGTKELTERLQTGTDVIRRKPRLAMHAKTTVLPTETQMQLHCGYLLTHPRNYSYTFRQNSTIFRESIQPYLQLIRV